MSEEFIFPKMTPEIRTYLDFSGSFRTRAQELYAPYRKFEVEWEAAGKPEGVMKSEVERLRKVHSDGLTMLYQERARLASVAGTVLDEYFAAQKQWRCRDSTKDGEATIHTSPSGKYQLTITRHSTGKGTWAYSKGVVACDATPRYEVCRNYSHFPFLFVEEHPNGHDYLICGENYQGQTIIELDTGLRKDYLPEEASRGFGFCWSSYQISPSKKTLAVNGCYWACPYEVWLVDFSEPMKTLDVLHQERDAVAFIGWHPDKPDTCDVGLGYDVCVPFNKREGELTDEEWEGLDRREAAGEEGLWKYTTDVLSTWSRA